MYYTLGLEQNIKTLMLLSHPIKGKAVIDIATLAQSYRQFLREIQPNVPHQEPSQKLYVYDEKQIAKLISLHSEDSILSDFEEAIEQPNYQSLSKAYAPIDRALDDLKKVEPDLHAFFHLIIDSIFYARSVRVGGGSVSSAIGTIWCANRKNWTSKDIIEFLIHELTHNLVFLDELRYKHYLDFHDIAKPENFAYSAILNKPRPLDKAFHSLVVAVEIIRYRQQQMQNKTATQIHPSSEIIIKNSRQCVQSILQRGTQKKLVTDRVLQILQYCQEVLE